MNVSAGTCKYVDSQGHVTYSDAPVANSRKISCIQDPPPIPKQSSQQPLGDSNVSKRPGEQQTPANAADDRRHLLEEELNREQEALAKARHALTEQEAMRYGDERNYARVLERLKPFQDDVAAHEKKIESIRQKLGNLR
jgi:hypothetical protein